MKPFKIILITDRGSRIEGPRIEDQVSIFNKNKFRGDADYRGYKLTRMDADRKGMDSNG